MSEELKYVTINTSMGWIGILASEKGLLVTTLPQSSDQQACLLLGNRVNGATLSPNAFVDLTERLNDYFNGKRVSFPDELDLSEATPFRCKVWEATCLIPHGETTSYLGIARQINKPEAARAVGQALGKNPLPIIVPCHRVLESNGGLGGFGGGLRMKKNLLNLESEVSLY